MKFKTTSIILFFIIAYIFMGGLIRFIVWFIDRPEKNSTESSDIGQTNHIRYIIHCIKYPNLVKNNK